MAKLNGLIKLVLSDRWLERYVGLTISGIVRGPLSSLATCILRDVERWEVRCKVPLMSIAVVNVGGSLVLTSVGAEAFCCLRQG